MLLTHMIDKIRPVRDSPPRQYATHPPLVRTRGGVSDVGGEGGGGVRTGTIKTLKELEEIVKSILLSEQNRLAINNIYKKGIKLYYDFSNSHKKDNIDKLFNSI